MRAIRSIVVFQRKRRQVWMGRQEGKCPKLHNTTQLSVGRTFNFHKTLDIKKFKR